MTARSKKEFLDKYSISEVDFDKTKLRFEDLLAIREDFERKQNDYDDVGTGVVKMLLKFPAVHSVRYRIKDAEHLMDKIVRYRLKHPKSKIEISNYEQRITDLIGIRVIHLFKSNWLEVHRNITGNFKSLEKPTANYRDGDPEVILKKYEDNGCQLHKHPAGYRSVHYLIETSPSKKKYKVEVQVRTIFEEGWGEIDHTVRYPNNLNNPLMNEFSRILNRLAGSADEMGEFVLGLRFELAEKERQLFEKTQQIEELKKQINASKLAKKEKTDLTSGLDKILSTGIFNTSHQILDLSPGSNISKYFKDMTNIQDLLGSNSFWSTKHSWESDTIGTFKKSLRTFGGDTKPEDDVSPDKEDNEPKAPENQEPDESEE